jgi:WXG100 family type VII secretion target
MPDVENSLLQVPAELEQYGGKLLAIAQNIDEKLIKLRQQLAPVADMWISDAANQYQTVQHEWNVAANDFMTAEGTLGHIAHLSNTNWNNYVDAEGTNVKNMRGY